MNSKFVKTMLFAFLTVGLAVSCAPRSSGGNTPGGDTPGGDTLGGDTPGGDTPGGDTPGGDTPGGDPGDVTSFPVDDIKAFFAGYEIDIQNLPSYATASEKANFETDDSFEGYFDVYVNDTTSAELVAYKNALKTAGWTVVSADEETSEDFKLKYGETDAYADLLDFTTYVEEGEAPYNLVSFYVKSGSGELSYTTASAIDAVGELMSTLLESTIPTHHDLDGDYIIVNFGNSATVEQVKAVSENYFVPAGFEKSIDWKSASFSDGTPVDYIVFVWENIGLEFDVFEESGNENPNYDGVYFQASAFEVEPEETISINETAAEFFAAIGLEFNALPDFSSLDAHVEDVDVDITGEGGHGIYLDFYFDGDYSAEIVAILADWDEYPASFGRGFVDSTKTVSAIIGSDLFGDTVLEFSAYVEPDPIDWGTYGSLNGLLAAFLEATGIEGHTAKDLSSYESYVVDWYADFEGEYYYPNFNIWVMGDKVSDITTILEGFGYVPANETSTDKFVSADGKLTVEIGYSDEYGQSYVYVMNSEDLVLVPLDDLLDEFFAALEIDPDFPSFAAYDNLYIKNSTKGNPDTGSFRIVIEGDVVDAICALFSDGWTAGEDSWGDPLYTNADGTISVNVYASSGNTVVSIKVSAPAAPADPLDDQIAAFFAALEIEPDFPSFAAYDQYVDIQGTEAKLDDDFFRIVLTGDFVDEICALFGDGWTAGVDDWGDPLYTNADGSISVNVYSMYGSTIVAIQYNGEAGESGEEGTSETFPTSVVAKYFQGVSVPALDGASSYAYETLTYGDFSNVIISASFADADAANAAAAAYISLLKSDIYGYTQAMSGFDTLVDPAGEIMIDVYVEGTNVIVDIYTNELA
jgi:hypothetical protein